MRIGLMAAASMVIVAAGCAQQEEEAPMITVDPVFDKYGNVVNGTIVDGVFILPDGTVVGPVSPNGGDDGGPNQNQNQNQNQFQNQNQVQNQNQNQQGQ